MEPIHQFVVSGELKDALSEKIAVLKHYEEKSDLQFNEAIFASARFRWEGKKTLGEIVLRESGDCDTVIVDLKTGSFFDPRYKRCVSKEEFYEMLAEFIAIISKNEERTS